MKINWKKTSIITIDTLLAIYLLLAITAFNNPKDDGKLCNNVAIDIADESVNAFLKPEEIKQMLNEKQLFPKNNPLTRIDPRQVEDYLKEAPFVNTAECYKTIGGIFYIKITQRTPLVRIKSDSSDDYYLDDKGGIMPNSKYTSDLIIATGKINRRYARLYITPLAKHIMASELWRNQIEQINILPNMSVELVPRVGNHIVKIGRLPETNDAKRRNKAIEEMLQVKLERLEKFYRYGLTKVGWQRYKYIDIEFDNQIICKRNNEHENSGTNTLTEQTATGETPSQETTSQEQNKQPNNQENNKTQN